jgi:hypothetical protein
MSAPHRAIAKTAGTKKGKLSPASIAHDPHGAHR